MYSFTVTHNMPSSSLLKNLFLRNRIYRTLILALPALKNVCSLVYTHTLSLTHTHIHTHTWMQEIRVGTAMPRHPNLAAFIGACFHRDFPWVVYEFIDGPNLSELYEIENRRQPNLKKPWSPPEFKVCVCVYIYIFII